MCMAGLYAYVFDSLKRPMGLAALYAYVYGSPVGLCVWYTWYGSPVVIWVWQPCRPMGMVAL